MGVVFFISRGFSDFAFRGDPRARNKSPPTHKGGIFLRGGPFTADPFLRGGRFPLLSAIPDEMAGFPAPRGCEHRGSLSQLRPPRGPQLGGVVSSIRRAIRGL